MSNDFINLLQNRNQSVIKLAYDFFYKKLGITSEEAKLIEVESVKRLADADGHCIGSYANGKLISIKIKVLHYSSTLGILDTLAHELVHAKQHLRGEFTFKEFKIPFLHFFHITKTERMHGGQILSQTPYFEMLCEQEAFNLSHRLMIEFCSNLHERLHAHETESTDIQEILTMGVKVDIVKKLNIKEKEEVLPRDFDLDFVDPIGDVDGSAGNKNERED